MKLQRGFLILVIALLLLVAFPAVVKGDATPPSAGGTASGTQLPTMMPIVTNTPRESATWAGIATDVIETPAPMATIPPGGGEFQDRIDLLEAVITTLVTKGAVGALDNSDPVQIVTTAGGIVLAGFVAYLLWNSQPQYRSAIKQSSGRVIDTAQAEVQKRADAAALTPDPSDDAKYQTMLAVLNRIEKFVGTQPVNTNPEIVKE